MRGQGSGTMMIAKRRAGSDAVTHRDRPPDPPPASAAMMTYRSDLAEVRAFVRACARGTGLSAQQVGDLVIAVSELAANTLRHTSGRGELHIWRAGGELVCQVHDSGCIADLSAGLVRPPADALHGHGLWVVRQLCDEVQIHSGTGGTTIRLGMRIGEPGPSGRRVCAQ